ncbi:MAG TPA: hypothetical protein VMW24_06035 [Sedimentisphaerales bacterium]|nr:hypothetical protein [Sedimentisphaerales bacterium]
MAKTTGINRKKAGSLLDQPKAESAPPQDEQEPVEGEVIDNTTEETALAIRTARENVTEDIRPISVKDGISLLPIKQQEVALAQYTERRQFFRRWLLSQLVQGVHYGFPPGCVPAKTDPLQWQAKPSLYKSGAMLLVDLLKFQVRYEADEVAWRQLGGQAGNFVMRAIIIDAKTGIELGEGRGVFAVGEKKMNANSAIKMAEKRALVDAVIHSVALCADLFTQDLDEPPPESAKPEKDPFAPKAPTRQERAEPVSYEKDIKPLYQRWGPLAVKQWPSEKKLAGRFNEYVESIAGRTIASINDWTHDLLAAVMRDLDANNNAVPVDQRE